MDWGKGRRKREKSAQENKYSVLSRQTYIRFVAKQLYFIFQLPDKLVYGIARAFLSYSF